MREYVGWVESIGKNDDKMDIRAYFPQAVYGVFLKIRGFQEQFHGGPLYLGISQTKIIILPQF